MEMRANGVVKKTREAQRKIYIQELQDRGITTSKDGVKIEKLDYRSLLSELTLIKFKEIDVVNAESKWF
jgi:hypothetical protein